MLNCAVLGVCLTCTGAGAYAEACNDPDQLSYSRRCVWQTQLTCMNTTITLMGRFKHRCVYSVWMLP